MVVVVRRVILEDLTTSAVYVVVDITIKKMDVSKMKSITQDILSS